jgi:DNA-binding CsgD family transcriptional regulator/tetratricopeptide (TPR) repeat protein
MSGRRPVEQHSRFGDVVDAREHLERGRRAYARRTWRDAYEALSRVDRTSELGAEDLELLATSAYMLGREDEWIRGLELAHHLYADAGDVRRAVRSAFWIGTGLALREEVGGATGWAGRAIRLLEGEKEDCVERGYVRFPLVSPRATAGDLAAASDVLAEVAEIGQRFGDADLFALAMHVRGQILITLGRAQEGLGLLDEAMVSVTSGRMSPIPTGLVYCGVIQACQLAYDLRRAREWTAALTRWCAEQPDLLSFTGRCRIHRAEILQLEGAWGEALEEARRAGGRPGLTQAGHGEAHYRRGEIHRLRGELDEAEEAYREAGRFGWEPQPGLALLRLARGEREAAAAGIRRVVGEAAEPLRRARLLPAYVEIMLAGGELDDARSACLELEELVDGPEGILGALSAQARGATALADGDAWTALTAARRACETWQELGAPHETARARVLIALACRELGDADAGEMELDAARRAFQELGAVPDLVRTEELARRWKPRPAGGLTAREVEVLRLVATGRTNRAIADELVISEKTVARHVSNIFTKLRISSRSAATAYAYEHDLV